MLADPPRVPASLLAVAAIFSVQFGNAFVGSLFESVGPLGAAALRLGFAAVILIVLVRPRVREWSARTWLGVVLLGIGMGGMNVFIYLAIAEIPLGLAVTIELMGPLAVAAAGIRRAVDAAWVLLALGGILLLGLDDTGTVTLRGALLAGVAAAFWALYILASARLSSRVRGIDGLVASVAVAAVVIVPLGAGQALQGVRQDPGLLGAFAVLALMTSVIAYGLEFLALKRMSARVFGVLSSLGPAVAALAGLAVLHQQLDARQLLAILLVVAASAGVVASSRRTV
ncbi:EamA family transporter [Leucobacter tenebrionis]|uniref:EamA family transporter n=1 Tax=Leucobacter tenebrionis TaxID=2873270 RepID=UPI001CA6EE50|nr:EamA family transporter [Leucobacter tenebrionis]QZY52697.1 EamA family transporter [Leucobacter tenebrionis]